MFDLLVGHTRPPAWFLCAALALIATAPRLAAAQASASDKAAAEMLYDRGIEQMREGKTAEACASFEQSQAIERGIGTMLHLAECYENLGRTASAWALFREAASTARFEGQMDRVKWGNDRAAALAPKLSMLTLQVSPDNQLTGFELTRNGAAIGPGLWNVPVPVDPGVHKLRAHAPGYNEWTAEVSVGANADSVTMRVPALTAKPTPEPVAVEQLGEAPAPTAAPSPAAAPARSKGGWRAQGTVGLITAGAGVVALGVGGIFGATAMSKKSDLDACSTRAGTDEQPRQSCTVPMSADLLDSGKSAATLSTVLMIGGGVLAAAGLVLYITADSDDGSETALSVDLQGAGARVTLGGAF